MGKEGGEGLQTKNPKPYTLNPKVLGTAEIRPLMLRARGRQRGEWRQGRQMLGTSSRAVGRMRGRRAGEGRNRGREGAKKDEDDK